MKSILTILIPISILATSCVVTRGPVIVDDGPVVQPQPQAQAPMPPPQQPPAPAGNYQQFYDELSPYGQWINNPTYGYVWVPAAGPDFVPYSTAGSWVYSSYGWTWVSDYSWGWAVFHYGLWDYDNFYGWYWIPNSQWGPAWVSWRSSPGYYGWAPLTPQYSFNGGNSGYYTPQERYVYVPQQYITSPGVSQYYAPRSEYGGYYSHSTVIATTNYDNQSHATYVAGPQQAEVEHVTGHAVTPVSFSNSSSPGHTQVTNGQISIYRPAIAKVTPGKGPMPAPAKITAKSEIVAPAHRVAVPQKMNPASLSGKSKTPIPNENRNEENERTKKAEPQPNNKSQEKPQVEPNNKPQEKPQVQPQPQPKPQQQPQPKTQPKPQPKPKPKPAPAPENKKQEEKH